jgi:hypothetical protein
MRLVITTNGRRDEMSKKLITTALVFFGLATPGVASAVGDANNKTPASPGACNMVNASDNGMTGMMNDRHVGVAANPIQESPIVVRITDIPRFFASPRCAAGFLLREKLRAASGQVIGNAEFCFRTEDTEGDTITETEDVTFHVPGGAIYADLTQVNRATSPSSVLTRFTGPVTGGTGHNLGAEGTVTGTGSITFDADGVPHPDLTFTITLS